MSHAPSFSSLPAAPRTPGKACESPLPCPPLQLFTCRGTCRKPGRDTEAGWGPLSPSSCLGTRAHQDVREADLGLTPCVWPSQVFSVHSYLYPSVHLSVCLSVCLLTMGLFWRMGRVVRSTCRWVPLAAQDPEPS